MIATALVLLLTAQTPPMSYSDNPKTPVQVEVNRVALDGLKACLDVAGTQLKACTDVVAAFVSTSSQRAARRSCSTGWERAEDACYDRNGFEIPPAVFQRRNGTTQVFAEFDACAAQATRKALECMEGGESEANCTKTALAAADRCGVEQRAKIDELDIPDDGLLRAKRRRK